MKPLMYRGRNYMVFLVFYLFILFPIPTNCKAQETKGLHSILLLIDVSGSMTGAKIDSVKSAAKQIIKMLLPCNTEFSIMGFSGKKENPVLFRFDFSTNEADLLAFVDKLKPEGGTLLGAALKIGSLYVGAYKNKKSVRQTIILLGDGRSDDNVTAILKELKDRKAFVPCECIGFDIVNDKLAEAQLKQIAHETSGEYYYASNVTSVVKAFFKTSIKTIIHEIPVVVRKPNKNLNFKVITENINKLLTTQNWILDSIQVNVSDSLYEITQFIVADNMQDTLPKSLIFDSDKKISLFINQGTEADVNKKWIEGNYTFVKNALAISISHYYFNLMVRAIDKHSMVLCVNKFMNLTDFTQGSTEEVCNCSNKITKSNPYILIYFSQAGCNH